MIYRPNKNILTKKVMLPNPVLTKFRRKIHDDNDVFLIIAGKRGSTKSGSGIQLGTEIDVNVHGQTRFYLDQKYYPKEFSLLPGEALPRTFYMPSILMDMLKNNDKYPIGTAAMWDEVGVEGDARDFAMKKNKLLKRTFQTIRSLNWFMILNAVTKKDFDVAFERNAGFWMKTYGKCTLMDNDGNLLKYGKSKIYEIDVDARTGKTYDKHLQYFDVDGKYKTLSSFYYVKKPRPMFENPYKRFKRLFQTKLYSSYASELDEIDNFSIDDKTQTEIQIFDEKLKEIIKNPLAYFDLKKRKFSLAAIQYEGSVKILNDAKARKVASLLVLKLNNGQLVIDELGNAKESNRKLVYHRGTGMKLASHIG